MARPQVTTGASGHRLLQSVPVSSGRMEEARPSCPLHLTARQLLPSLIIAPPPRSITQPPKTAMAQPILLGRNRNVRYLIWQIVAHRWHLRDGGRAGGPDVSMAGGWMEWWEYLTPIYTGKDSNRRGHHDAQVRKRCTSSQEWTVHG